MVALALIAMLGASPVTDTLANFRGQPVLMITIEAPADEDEQFLRSLIDIQPGYLLATSQLQSAIKRIYALGRFANVEVSAQRLSGVVLLHFRLLPIKRLDILEIEGLTWAEEEPLRAALKLRPGAEVDRRTPERLQQRGKEHLAAVGFPNATVTVEPLAGEPSARERSYRLRIMEAVPDRIAAIRFTGTPRVHRSVLRSLIKSQPGEILNRKRLERDRERLEHALIDHGFLRAQVDDPLVQTVGEVHTVLFNIDAGDRVVIELTGMRSVTEDDLRALWPEESPRLRSGSLTAFGEAIEEHYRRRGFADVKVAIRGYRDAERGITRYLYIVHEGEPVRVIGIEFIGAVAIPAATLEEHVRSVLQDELREGADFQQITDAELAVAAVGSREFGSNSRSPSFQTRYPPEERWVPELYERALDGILAVYKDRGYLEAELSEPELRRRRSDLRIRIRVTEGPQTLIHSVRFRGNEALTAADLLSELERQTGLEEGSSQVSPGGPFSASGIETGRIALVRRYRDRGYLYAKIFSEAQPAEDVQATAEVDHADLIFWIEEGPQVRIRNILVRGNRHTDTDTIRSQISLEPGDIYRLDQAIRDQRAISRLGVFESVRVKLIDEERPEEQKDLVAEVSERKRQLFEPFAGLSTADGVRAGIGYSHNNLFGYAANLNLEARFNRQFFFEVYGADRERMEERYRNYSTAEQFTKGLERVLRAGLRSRRFSIGPVGTALRIDFTNEMDQAVTYSAHETAVTTGVDVYPLPKLAIAVEPQVSYTDAECTRQFEEGEEANDQERGQCWIGQGDIRTVIPEGEQVAFQVGSTVTFDYRDDQFRPTEGFWIKASAIYAIGSSSAPVEDTDEKEVAPFSYTKLEGTIIGYLPLWGPVLVLTAQAGHIARIEGKVPINERLYVGGRDSMRGFPQDRMIADDGEDAPGGNTFFILRSELRVDITESFSIDLFADVGNLWIDLDRINEFRARLGIGAGLRYNTAVGAVVLDFGFNPMPRSTESVFEPHFSVSRF